MRLTLALAVVGSTRWLVVGIGAAANASQMPIPDDRVSRGMVVVSAEPSAIVPTVCVTMLMFVIAACARRRLEVSLRRS